MTLILALANKEFVVQISDRRLSSNGRLVDDESNKCGVIFCLNARMAFGYTGLASWREFSTPRWLLKALHDSASPDYTIGETLERLKEKATDTFNNHPILKSVPKVHKKLAVMFSSYINIDGVVKPSCAILSNYHNFTNNTRYDEVSEEFCINYSSAQEGESNPTLVQRVGNWLAMTDEDISELREFLLQGKPNQAVVGKALEIFRDIADRPKSSGTIGKQLTSIVIHKDPNLAVNSDYSTDCIRRETYMPAMVYLLPEQHMTIDNIFVRPVDADTPPISVPKVGRNIHALAVVTKNTNIAMEKNVDNRALHRMQIPLRSICTCELGR